MSHTRERRGFFGAECINNSSFVQLIFLLCEPCHIWMSHVTYEWVMPHMDESCHVGLGRVTYEYIMLHMNKSCNSSFIQLIFLLCELCNTWISHVTCAISHVTWECVTSRMNELCHIWIRHVTCGWVISFMNESCHSSFIQLIFLLCESCHVWMSHVTCAMSHLAYEWVMFYIWVNHI